MAHKWADYEFPQENIFKLGPLECVTSSFINALILWGRNYKNLLLNYWCVDYFKKLLLGSRNLNLCFIPFLYGITIQLRRGKTADLDDLLQQDHIAIVQCKASQMAYFPARYLTHEDRGLGHTFLLYGYRSVDNTYRIVDAMANFSGTIPAEQLEVLKDGNGNLSYFPLMNDEYSEPDIEAVFAKATQYNYALFNQKVFNCGQKALTLFYNDIQDSVAWSKIERNQWLDQNQLTISGLINNRSKIWNCYKEMKMLRPEEELFIEENMSALVKQWKLLIFLMLKLKKNANGQQCRDIKLKLKLLRDLEGKVLFTMNEAGRRFKKETPIIPTETH
ncbi:MAG: hypothetical protein JXD23_13105 [Spirochaetales bacterium]|nr:hypothetical protein [Spirochaetales bacterium]